MKDCWRRKRENLLRLLKAFDELQLWLCQSRVADIEKALIPFLRHKPPGLHLLSASSRQTEGEKHSVSLEGRYPLMRLTEGM